jgi:hypothetical protein
VIPKDNKWHKININFEYWIKRDKELLIFDSFKSYLDDGEVESEYNFSNNLN